MKLTLQGEREFVRHGSVFMVMRAYLHQPTTSYLLCISTFTRHEGVSDIQGHCHSEYIFEVR